MSCALFHYILSYTDITQVKYNKLAKSITSQVAQGAGAYLRRGLCSVKRMIVFDFPWTGH